ncbi:hypothetical protein CR513_07654, partial [Mucuna pruriens]
MMIIFVVRVPESAFNVGGHGKGGGGKHLNVGDFVVLSCIHSQSSAHQERKAAPNYSHYQIINT